MKSNFLNRLIFSIIFAPLVLYIIFVGDVFFKILIFFIFIFGIYEIKKLTILYSKIIIFFVFIMFLLSCIKIMSMNDGYLFLYFIIILTWLSDIGGYIVGKIIGGKKINLISPNKTYSGFLGSFFFSFLSIFYMYEFNILIFNSISKNLFVIMFLCLITIMGDLVFSYFKRINNIKDYSKLLKGHGGLFDRIDGLIFSTIFFNLFL